MEETDCPNKAYDNFMSIFSHLYDEHFPIRKIKLKLKDIQSPWITKGIKKSSRMKQRLYEKYLKNKTDNSLQKL